MLFNERDSNFAKQNFFSKHLLLANGFTHCLRISVGEHFHGKVRKIKRFLKHIGLQRNKRYSQRQPFLLNRFKQAPQSFSVELSVARMSLYLDAVRFPKLTFSSLHFAIDPKKILVITNRLVI